LGEIDDELKEIIGIDTQPADIGNTMFGFRNEKWKEWKTPWGQLVLVADKFETIRDAIGDVLIFPQGDHEAPPSAKMPKRSYFFDAIIRQEPLGETRLNPEDNLQEFTHISDDDLLRWKNVARRFGDCSRATVANMGGTALGDIAMIPAVHLKHPKGIRDIAEWYMSTLSRTDYIHEVFEKQTNIALQNLKRIHAVTGNAFDVVFICGTDFGTQNSAFCSVETFRELWMPYYQKINGWVHDHTVWKTFKHCCGSIQSFIPSLIESGFDILNPVQYGAADMDTRQLKDRFGEQIVFWGGGVDTQKVLPFGTPNEVREEVLHQCEILSKNGGFVFSSVHNVQANTPVENIVAMIEAVREFNS
jgi:hypothetical protein